MREDTERCVVLRLVLSPAMSPSTGSGQAKIEWGAEALRRTSDYGHALAGVVGCAGGVA